MLGRIYDYVINSGLSNHQKSVNIWLLFNKTEDFPKLPPEICPCVITLNNGSKFMAYIDSEVCGHNWTEYGNTFRIRRKGRRKWQYNEVKKWELK